MNLIKPFGLLPRLMDQLHPAYPKTTGQDPVDDLPLIPRPNRVGLYDSKCKVIH
jgi:hypothetical protein